MDIPIIAQREIEARMAAALVSEYAKTLGRDRALAIAGEAIKATAREAGEALSRRLGARSLEELARVVETVWAREGALTIDFIEISPSVLRFNVTRCRYAERYARMDVGDLGYYLSCGRDAAFAQGFNPDIRMARSQTIMQGAALCDFHFYLAT